MNEIALMTVSPAATPLQHVPTPLQNVRSRLPVTVVVPVKNEAENISACLETLVAFERVLVVDSSSTDDTIAIARAKGADVLNFRWAGGYPKKRNWILSTHHFTTDWVLFLDADERVTDAFVEEVTQAIQRSEMVAYWLCYDNYFMDRLLRHGVPQRKLALLRVGAGLFERIDDQGWSSLDMEVHENPIVNGKTGTITAPITHHDYKSLHHFLTRHNEYSTWEARRFQALVASDDWPKLTRRQQLKYKNFTRWWFAPAYFMLTYFLRLGFLDGSHGFAYAVLKASYFFEIRLKIREIQSRR